MQYIIFYRKHLNRKNDNNFKKNELVIIEQNNFDFEATQYPCCTVPLFYPFPSDETKRILLTPLFSENKTKFYGMLVIVVQVATHSVVVFTRIYLPFFLWVAKILLNKKLNFRT